MAFTCDYGQRKRKYEKQNLKREVELEEEYATTVELEEEYAITEDKQMRDTAGNIADIINNLVDNLYDEDLKCPHCGAKQEDDWELEEGDGTTECCDCEKKFKFNKRYIVKYTCEKIEEMGDDLNE